MARRLKTAALISLAAAIGCRAASVGAGADAVAVESCAFDAVDARAGADARSPSGADVDGGTAGPEEDDLFLPWEGGASYYRQWPHGPPSDPSFFPIAVWLQAPRNAARYRAIGINVFIGLYGGPTEAQLFELAAAEMPAVSDQSGVWAAHVDDPIIDAWRIREDEPDNAQPDGMGGYGPCLQPSLIVSEYQRMQANDGTRPIHLNLGQGVAYDDYIGRGSACHARLDLYPQYAEGADIVSFDIYPDNNTDSTTRGNLWFVARGVDRLREWTNYQKIVWNFIETTGIRGPAGAPPPADVRAEVWMSLVHGSMGIEYFSHVFAPSFIEAGLLADPVMSSAVAEINRQIHDLAPVLNTPSLANGARASTSNPAVPVDIMVKRSEGSLYIFAVAMRRESTSATFVIRRGGDFATAVVLGEARSIPLIDGAFTDDFEPYGVHLYRLSQ